METRPDVPCINCLRENLTEEELPQEIQNYIQNISEEDRTPEEIYQTRIKICKSCPNLLNETCQICGCYVKMRAALSPKACPLTPPKWPAYLEEYL